jgi:hypothetical protein
MIKIENVNISGWEAAIRGMRNPMNSWDKSDSCWCYTPQEDKSITYKIGESDLKLMKSLSKAGSDHGKFLRMINVTLDINAPLYWWKEFDTYKIGTVSNSCSTMHKIHSTPITEDDFSLEHVKLCPVGKEYFAELEKLRIKYNETKDKKYWYALIQLLPSSYNQKRTVMLNYQVLKTMYHARKLHKLDEWREFCAWCETLPYFKEICLEV